mmetsp:Transcript_36615/g.70269  ORF Transcript_36615/g.70269 Transcript_36615/m.70269 type:complete len:231 (-) Transcript_36615:658-1350(-)
MFKAPAYDYGRGSQLCFAILPVCDFHQAVARLRPVQHTAVNHRVTVCQSVKGRLSGRVGLGRRACACDSIGRCTACRALADHKDATDELRPQIEHRGQSIKKSNEKHPCTEQDIETVPTTDEASNDVGTEKTEHIERVEDNGSLQEANTLNLRSTDQLLLENRDVESCCKECDELLRARNFIGAHACYEMLEFDSPKGSALRKRAVAQKVMLEAQQGWGTFTLRRYLDLR